MEYALHIFVLAAIYSALAVSLDLVSGHLGLFSVCHAAFFGVGAYASAIMTTRFDQSFAVGSLVGMAAAATLSLVISGPFSRLQGDHCVIATFGAQMILFDLFHNWTSLTGGPMGIRGIPAPRLFGRTISEASEFLVLALVLGSVAWCVTVRLARSPFGRILHAIREDEAFAQACGKNTIYFKTITFAISAALAAACGTLYAHFLGFIDPSSFTLMESVAILAMISIGGLGTRWGAVIGAVVLVSVPELLRLVGLEARGAANLRQILFGGLLLAVLLWRPQGLMEPARASK